MDYPLEHSLDLTRITSLVLSHLTAPDAPLTIIGLGYVGLPLAVEFDKHRPVVGFDTWKVREYGPGTHT